MSDVILQTLAQSVRHWRRIRGLSRSGLAAVSGVSTRYLAQIESGTGNLSLLRLEQLARALALTPVQLLTPPSRTSVLRIALLGLRGAGKSTIGPGLATQLQLPFIELDDLIEETAGMASGPIFELHGEQYFRRLERETLARFLAAGQPAVLATGGGLVMEPETYTLLREHCTTVWLSAAPEDHYDRVLAQGDRRPMADNPHAMAELRALLASRESLYRQADLSVDTSSCTVSTAIKRIQRAVSTASQ